MNEEMSGLQMGQAPKGYKSGFASFLGRPNVGKSTLTNQILRQKISITSPRPQTTRNAIRGVLTTDKAQAIFVDTPGFHKPRSALGEKLNSVVRTTLSEVDVILFVLDGSEPIGRGDAFIAAQLSEVSTPIFVVVNKSDLLDPAHLAAQRTVAERVGPFASVHMVSAKSGMGVAELLSAVTAALPEGPLFYPPDMVTDQPEVMLMAELIREKALRLTREEVPHSIAVVIEEMRPPEREDGVIEVDAILYVERDSQKGIVIGHRGQVLKQIGTESRREIEALLGNRIYLDLRVKVKRDWQKQSGLIDRFGYGT